MSASSSDIALRDVLAHNRTGDHSDGDSGMPAWMATQEPASVPISVSNSSDADSEDSGRRAGSRHNPDGTQQETQDEPAAAGPSSERAAAAAAASRPGSKAAAGRKAAAAAAAAAAATDRKQPKAPPVTIADTLQLPSQMPASQAGGSQLPLKAGGGASSSRPSEIALQLPEKLPRSKVLVELEAADHQATDLSGDAGAVGRLIITGQPGKEELKLDLKGVLYSATVRPLPGTCMVINIGPTEAKVESVMNDFLRLKEEVSFYAADGVVEGALGDDLMASDDENYRAAGGPGGVGGDDGEDGAAKPKKAKSKPKPKSGGPSKALSKTKKAGVKKKKPPAKSPKKAAGTGAKAKKAAGASGSGGAGKGKAAAAEAAAKPKVAKKRRKADSDEGDDEDTPVEDDSDWSG